MAFYAYAFGPFFFLCCGRRLYFIVKNKNFCHRWHRNLIMWLLNAIFSQNLKSTKNIFKLNFMGFLKFEVVTCGCVQNNECNYEHWTNLCLFYATIRKYYNNIDEIRKLRILILYWRWMPDKVWLILETAAVSLDQVQLTKSQDFWTTFLNHRTLADCRLGWELVEQQ